MVYIIAEIGVNHDGNIEKAKELIHHAKISGADAVKFQSFKAMNLVSKDTQKADYQKDNENKNESQYEMLERLELSEESMKELKEYAENREMEFLSSPFDIDSVASLERIGITKYKVPSGEITNPLLLRAISRTNKEILLSTGLSYLGEIENAIRIIREEGNNNIVVLQCNTEYPTPAEDVNLKVMSTLKSAFNVRVGYSDHTIGDEVPVAAVALGAEVIEKHFTLDDTDEGPDHKASMMPNDFKEMVRKIRNVEKALGNSIKQPTPSEIKNKSIVRKKIIACKDIKKGQRFTEENITVKRAMKGIDAEYYYFMLTQRSNHDFNEGECVVF